MGEMSAFLSRPRGAYPACVQRINYPVHQGKPNPVHGKFYFVGSIPEACYDASRDMGRGGSKIYDTEQSAIDAAIAAGATRIQKVDCSFALGK